MPKNLYLMNISEFLKKGTMCSFWNDFKPVLESLPVTLPTLGEDVFQKVASISAEDMGNTLVNFYPVFLERLVAFMECKDSGEDKLASLYHHWDDATVLFDLDGFKTVVFECIAEIHPHSEVDLQLGFDELFEAIDLLLAIGDEITHVSITDFELISENDFNDYIRSMLVESGEISQNLSQELNEQFFDNCRLDYGQLFLDQNHLHKYTGNWMYRQ